MRRRRRSRRSARRAAPSGRSRAGREPQRDVLGVVGPERPRPRVPAGRSPAVLRRRGRPGRRTAWRARALRTPAASSPATHRVAVRPDQPPAPSRVPPNHRVTTATTSLTPRPRSTSSIGAPAVPDGSPSSLDALDVTVGPSTNAEQWCRASQCSLRARSTTARAASSSRPVRRGTGTASASPRSPRSAARATVVYDVLTAAAPPTSEPIFTMNAPTTTTKNTRTNRLPFDTAVRAPT